MESSWANSRNESGGGGGGQRTEAGGGTEVVPGVDLHVDLGGMTAGTRGLRDALAAALRDAVREGRLVAGARLPSSRALAADLGVARNTVASAYAELGAEGWLTGRQGSGTRVAHRTRPVARHERTRGRYHTPAAPHEPADPTHNLLSGRPDVSTFPRAAWLSSARRALHSAPHSAFGYGDPRGRPELRRALADYLARARSVRTDPDHIVVCRGFAEGLSLLGEVLRQGIALESYGLWIHRDILRRADIPTSPVAVDEHGARVAEVAATGRKAALLTPAHQYPTGVPLHPDRRAAIVDWARRADGLVLEDDYDGEFRYDRSPVGAVQSLAPDRVVYLGTASKSLVPGLRLGWMVVPDPLLDDLLEAVGERQCGVLDQLTMADFIEHGAYDRHLRAMRLRYRRRRDQLVAALAERAPRVRVTGIAAGLHAVLELPPGTEGATVRAAARRGIVLYGLSDFRHPEAPAPEAPADALVVGYGTPPDHDFPATLDALCDVLPTGGR